MSAKVGTNLNIERITTIVSADYQGQGEASLDSTATDRP